LLADNLLSGFLSICLNGPTTLLGATAPTAGPTLTLYPNPSHGQVLLTLPGFALTAQVLDALGRVVRTVFVAGTNASLDAAGLAPGVYAVRGAGQVGRLIVN